MNQIEQVTSIPSAVARRDERIAELEQRIERIEAVLVNWLEILQIPTAIPLFGLDLTE